MPRYFEEITWKELSKKIKDALGNRNNLIEKNTDPMLEDIGCEGYDWLELTPQIEKDLSKVEFDTENVIYERDHFHCINPTENFTSRQYEYRFYPVINPLNQLLGFNTFKIDNKDFVFLGFMAGGDWEVPVHFIIYWDGKKLRGYIPTDGNPWNTDTKEAYGNDEESDKKNIKKRKFEGDTYNIIRPDVDKIIADIKSRIKPR